jgi:hypothetical protein
MVVTMSNFVGYMIEEAVRLGFRQIVLIGHPGKLIKVAAGIFHTHSHIADARMETLVAHLALLGAPLALLQLVSECDTTEAAMEHIDAYGFQHIYHHLAERICLRVMQMLRFTKTPPSATPSCSPLITRSSAAIGRSPRLRGRCHVNGGGMGPLHLMTPAARDAVASADALVGGKRHLQQFPEFDGERFALGPILPNCWYGSANAKRRRWCWPPATRCFTASVRG